MTPEEVVTRRGEIERATRHQAAQLMHLRRQCSHPDESVETESDAYTRSHSSQCTLCGAMVELFHCCCNVETGTICVTHDQKGFKTPFVSEGRKWVSIYRDERSL